MAHVVVIGAGIAGLTAAYRLAGHHDVTVLEGSPRVGGKLRTAEVAGVGVDVGAEAMLNRRPEGVGLARELGIEVVHPTAATSRLWTGGRLRALPRSLLGVPMDLRGLAESGVLSEAGMAAVLAEPRLATPPPAGDLSVADLVGGRLGEEVVERLVEPLLGGVYAGHAHELSARAAVPRLVAMAERGSLLEGAAAVSVTGEPVFAGIVGGMGTLPGELVTTGGFTVRTGAPVRALRRTPAGFELEVGSAAASEHLDCDHVVLATPAAPAARLLADVAPVAAATLAEIDYASVAVVTMAFRVADLPGGVLDGRASGFLVPPSEDRRIKAATFSFAKWDWVRRAGRGTGQGAGEDGADLALLRTSLGRHREEAVLQAEDADLVTDSLADLAGATGLAVEPVDSHVQRWGGALPQYAVGHLDRVERVRAALAAEDPPQGAAAGRLAVCGAAYDGLGIPAVIGSAERAATRIGH